MPALSRFSESSSACSPRAGGRHPVAHFHAHRQEQVAVISIEPIDVIAGSLPTRQRRLVEAWAELHQQELRDDWNRLQHGQLPKPIEPLAWPLMRHPIYRVESAEVVAPLTLRIRFDDGLERRIDFSPILAGALFGPLRDRAVFDQVRVDPEIHTVVWPNGADFDPATLHDWPANEAAFRELAQRWELAAT